MRHVQPCRTHDHMEARAEFLRRQIELYRRYLCEGQLEAEIAAEYLRRLAAAEAELAEIVGRQSSGQS